MGTLVSKLKGVILMTNKEKLIDYIHNLTNEEADLIIAFLKESASSEEVCPLLPLCNSLQEREVVV